ncbi:PKD domain-containing protein, partial [Rhodonellum sp.]|uniref:PKD domain-containing protein n=1 Tax=Rhodonellum sp. TaxID=2231180 RepID=UPI002715C95F
SMFGIDQPTGELTVYNLPLGDYTYYLEVSDPLICTVSSRADVKVTAVPNPILDKVDILCFGEETGKILLVSGADPKIVYSINGGAPMSQSALEALEFAAGIYVIDFRDVDTDCGSSQTLEITQPALLEFELLNKVDPICGADNGSIEFSLIGGTKGYTITINNQPIVSYNPTLVGDSYTLENLAEGIYEIKILDANDCPIMESVTLANTNLLPISATDTQDEVCEGSPAVFVPIIDNQSGVNPTKRWFKDQNLTDEIISNYSLAGTGVMYQIDPITGTLSVYNLAAGDFTFYLELTDAQICPIVAKAEVKVNPFPLSQFGVVDILCFGDQTGKITLLSAGSPDLRFTVNGGAQMTQAALQAMDFSAGIYTIETINIGAICPDVQIKEIKQPEELIFEEISFLDPTCGESNGDVVFRVAGGKAPYIILINGQPLSAFAFAVDNGRYVIGNLNPGIYDISITDANGCTEGGDFELTNIVATPITADKMEAEVCEGTPIEFTPVFQSGGVDPQKRWFRDATLTQEILNNFAPTGTGVMYQIDPVSGKLTVYNLLDGNYTYYLQLSDPQICTLVTTAEGIVNPGIEAQAIVTNEVCFGEANGSILLDALSGGSGVYEFSLDNANWQSGNLFDNLSSGTFTVYIRDLGGQASCVLTLPNILVEAPEAPISINNDFILIPSSCDLPNGSISNVVISGGWGNFTFEWRKGSATGTVVTGTISGAEDLFPDLYYLIVRDEKGCEEIFEFEIKEQEKPNFEPIVPMAICALEDMTLTVIQNVQGASGTQFTWSKGPNQANPIVSGPDGAINGVAYEIREVMNTVHLDISGLPAGSYTYYFFAECTGQEIPISFEVVPIPDPEFGILEISCFDADNGKIAITSGGSLDLTYSVDGGSFISQTDLEAMNFGPGTYTILAKNGQGCISLPQTLTFANPAILEIELLDSKNSACGTNDGFIEVSLKGGTPEYTLILIKNGVVVETVSTSAAEYTFNNLGEGVYEVELRDQNDCQVDLAGDITLLDGPTEILIDDAFIICEGESVTLEPSINPATANPVYTWYWNSPTAGNELSDQQQISGILFEINAAGDLTISGLQTGKDYKVWVKVSGPDICEGDLKEVLIQVESTPVFTAIASDENCFGTGGAIQITQGTGQNNVAYSVNGGPFQSYPGYLINGLAPGNYTIAAQNAGGCIADLAQTFVIVGPSAELSLSNIQATNANCGATDGTLTGQINGGTPGYQISLLDASGNVILGPVLSSDGSVDFSNLGSGAYSLTITDALGCTLPAQSILIDESPKVILADDQLICEGEVAVIRPSLVPADGAITFDWFYDKEMTRQVSEVGTPDQFGATYQIATDGEIRMSGLPSRPAPYTYYIMVAEAGNCPPEVKEVNVTVRPIPTLRVSNPSIVCDPNQTVNLTQFIEGFNPNVFDYIVTSPNGNRLRLEDLATVSGTGSYTVQSSFKGSNCWTPMDRIAVIISDIQLIADFQYEILVDGQVMTDYDLQLDDEINFKDISQGNVIVWNWDFGDGTSSTLQNPTHFYDAPGRYTIRLTTIDQFGCTSVIERVLEIFNDYLIKIPNAFTPDGLNNKFFKPKFRGIVTMKLYIFNTWGDLIYETDNLEDQGWDGKLNGQNTPNGNYVYKAIFTTRTNETIERAGVFILIR